MKNYLQFIKEEAELKGNKGLPDDWMDKTDQKAQRDLGVRKDEPTGPPLPPPPPGFQPPQGMQVPPPGTRIPGPQVMRLSLEFKNKMNGVASILKNYDENTVKEKFSELAEEAVREEFGKILDDIGFDIKMTRIGEVAEDFPQLKDIPEDPKSKDDQADEITKDDDSDEIDKDDDFDEKDVPFDTREDAMAFLNSEKLKRDIDKKKLMDMVVHGEGINTKNILHSDIIKAGLVELLGEDDGTEVHRLYDEISKIHIKMSWLDPLDSAAEKFAKRYQDMAGACKVSWESDSSEDGDGDVNDEEESQGENGMFASDDLEKLLNDIEESGDVDGEEVETNDGHGLITVRGVDLPMLIHEAVKGVYLMIVSNGLMSYDDTTRDAVKKATFSGYDEAEGSRYGPYIAAELRDFINSCDGSDKLESARTYVFGEMVQLPTDQFLELMLGIFEKTSKAKLWVENTISGILQQISDYERGEVDDQISGDDVEVAGDDDSGDELDKMRNQKRGYAQMSQAELNDVLNQLLDDKNYAEIEKLKKYLPNNESVMSKIIFEKAVEKIMRSKK